MKFCVLKTWLALLVATTAGGWVIDSNADEEIKIVAPVEVPLPPVPPAPPQVRYARDVAEKIIATTKVRTSLASGIRSAAEAVRDAKGDEAKAAAQKSLSELLDKYFDEDMARREKELTQIEERLAKLRELLERRRAKKQYILDLQVKVALNEADGLGFYDDAQPGRGKPMGDLLFRANIEHDPLTITYEGGPPIKAPAKVSASGTSSEASPKPKPKSDPSPSKSKADPLR